MHVDHNEKERVLVYEYFKDTFLALLDEYPDFPLSEIKKILRRTAEAVKELHEKDWIHIGAPRSTIPLLHYELQHGLIPYPPFEM